VLLQAAPPKQTECRLLAAVTPGQQQEQEVSS